MSDHNPNFLPEPPQNIKQVETIRAFIALPLVDSVWDVLKNEAAELIKQTPDKDINWVPYANYHITLCFLGNIPVSDIEKIENVMAQVAGEFAPFDTEVGPMNLYPDFERNGIFTATVMEDEPLLSLQSTLQKELEKHGYQFPSWPYRPHVTIARLRKNIIPTEIFPTRKEFLTNPITKFHLYKSERINGVVKNDIVRSRELR